MENFQTDEYGQFTIENLPLGTHPVYVTTVNGNPTNVAFLFDNRGAQSILGPVPASVAAAVSGEDLLKNHDQTFFPESSNSTPSSSSRSETTSFDPTTSFGNGGISYHNHESHPMNSLPNDVDYGHICTYEAHGITGPQTKECNFTENPEAISIEIIAEFENLDTENSYRKNIVGKLWNTYSGIFSLAIINNECGVTSPSLAFFASNGAGFTCENAVISSAVIETGKQHFITALWIDNALEIFMDGFMIAFRVVQNTPSTILDAPIFLGDDNLTFILDEVQLGNKAITSADVLYRYYHKGGER